MLGEFTREEKTDGSLDFTRRQGGLVVVLTETTRFSGDLFEGVTNERVHDGHSLAGDTSIRVNLLQNLVDVGRVSFSSLLSTLGSGSGFLGTFGSDFLSGHDELKCQLNL